METTKHTKGGQTTRPRTGGKSRKLWAEGQCWGEDGGWKMEDGKTQRAEGRQTARPRTTDHGQRDHETTRLRTGGKLSGGRRGSAGQRTAQRTVHHQHTDGAARSVPTGKGKTRFLKHVAGSHANPQPGWLRYGGGEGRRAGLRRRIVLNPQRGGWELRFGNTTWSGLATCCELGQLAVRKKDSWRSEFHQIIARIKQAQGLWKIRGKNVAQRGFRGVAARQPDDFWRAAVALQ